ncbi:uncharacterized protein [Cebidichthys violaceus]|uniref:uncharacterized protein isoform X2 n=1 Tax=Cebidichthys violaceus TaxID=271503 RepID=UPI0035CAA2B8
MAKQREKTTQPSDINQTSAPVAKKSKAARRSEEGLRARKESDRLRVKTRINISYSFTRWRKLKEEKNLRTDADVANYLLNFYEKRSSISTGTCMQEPSALSSLGCVSASERGKQRQRDDVEHQSETTHVATEVDWLQDSFEEMEVTIDDDDCNSVKSRLSDLDSDLKNIVETSELSAVKAEDSCDEDVYTPIVPQSSTASELLLECEEEELEPWQKHTLCVHLKQEDDAGEFSMSHQILEETCWC